jgi:hypothetical protein
MLGALWMLVWIGLSSVWQRQSFWIAENLMATAFRRDAPLSGAGSTFPGLALYLLMYSLLGGLFALVVRRRLPRVRLLLLSVLFGLAWYWFSFQWMWKTVMPLVAAWHVEQSTMLGHLVYGTVLGRYPLYLARLEQSPAEAVTAPPMVPVVQTALPGGEGVQEIAEEPSGERQEPPPDV